ncbi:glutathione S-transferase [Pusillimonas sp. ANT_WB101]|uniref:glutathione S-transferase n=1 Tax=Pusillimonas sp. ANT_WB101 TaxID=2597356 RepID=UPI0011EEAAD7|nr:glutathione S-transferase [Pusillimonas sp. ANT_WB101]KAA0892981.1 glutathione S-transferase [Pusillimonas sp. ANT_WB101]
MTYELWYWNGIPGRGEFVRLALEAGGIEYRDCAREKGGETSLLLNDLRKNRKYPPFAPPYLVADDMVVSQTPAILLFLGERHGLAPEGTKARIWVHQLQLTIADLVVEAHDTHHPIASGMYYEEQRDEALRRAPDFRENRLPKFLGYFEAVLTQHEGWLVEGHKWSYADLSLFQVLDGLQFAFPQRMSHLAQHYQRVMALHERVAALPELQGYLSSDRRLPFGDGLFRHYPELDAA